MSKKYILIISIIMMSMNISSQTHQIVNSKQAREIINENKGNSDFHIIDAREKSKYQEGHIPGAKHIDPRIKDSRSKLKQLDNSATYLIYCRTRVRIFELAKIMRDMGFENIIINIDGWLIWEKAGFEKEVPDS